MESEQQEIATPGTAIVRSNTPRPLTQEEEPVKPDESKSVPTQDTSEFVWLFEYGLGMDGAYINSPERLNGLALFYGPAVVKGYHIVFGILNTGQIQPAQLSETFVTIVPSSAADAEVWGALYRIPRRVTQADGATPSLLDRMYATGELHTSMQSRYHTTHIVAHESRRKRDVSCITYVVAAQSQILPLSPQQSRQDPLVQHLAALASEQKLPERYVKSWAPILIKDKQDRKQQALAASLDEQNTEPLPIVSKKERMLSASPRIIRKVRNISLTPSPGRWLVVFACYLLAHLLVVLTLLLLQGFGMLASTPLLSFKLLAVPWLVLLYGLLGGCMSGIITLARSPVHNPPHFVMITWFTRPYIGAALALLAYLLLNSQLLALDLTAHPHSALSLLICALAGFSEGWLFTRRE